MFPLALGLVILVLLNLSEYSLLRPLSQPWQVYLVAFVACVWPVVQRRRQRARRGRGARAARAGRRVVARTGHELVKRLPVRVVFVQKFVPHYRLPFFEGVRAALAARGIEFVLLYGRPDPYEGSKVRTVRPEWGVELDARILRVRGPLPLPPGREPARPARGLRDRRARREAARQLRAVRAGRERGASAWATSVTARTSSPPTSWPCRAWRSAPCSCTWTAGSPTPTCRSRASCVRA